MGDENNFAVAKPLRPQNFGPRATRMCPYPGILLTILSLLAFFFAGHLDAAMQPLPGIGAGSLQTPVEVTTYLRALEGVRTGGAHSRQVVHQQRIRGTSHVSPPGTAGPGKYASGGGNPLTALTQANKQPKVPSILNRMKSVAGDDAVPMTASGAPTTPSPAKYTPGKKSPATPFTPTAAASGAEGGPSSSAKKAVSHQQLIRIPTPKVTSRDRLPVELSGIRTEPVEVPIYLPLPHPSSSTATATTATAAVPPSSSYSPAAAISKGGISSSDENDSGKQTRFTASSSSSNPPPVPVHVTVNLPKEAFPSPHPHAHATNVAAAAAARSSAVLVPITFSSSSSASKSNGSSRRKRASPHRAPSAPSAPAVPERQKEIIVPISLQGGSGSGGAARKKEKKKAAAAGAGSET